MEVSWFREIYLAFVGGNNYCLLIENGEKKWFLFYIFKLKYIYIYRCFMCWWKKLFVAFCNTLQVYLESWDEAFYFFWCLLRFHDIRRISILRTFFHGYLAWKNMIFLTPCPLQYCLLYFKIMTCGKYMI